MSHPLHLTQIIDLSREAHLPALARWAMKFAVLVTTWNNRFRSRRQLARLEQDRLEDIGWSKNRAMNEAARPFWKE